jgi:hypothetical protein
MVDSGLLLVGEVLKYRSQGRCTSLLNIRLSGVKPVVLWMDAL